jgi:hypothetical protein
MEALKVKKPSSGSIPENEYDDEDLRQDLTKR